MLGYPKQGVGSRPGYLGQVREETCVTGALSVAFRMNCVRPKSFQRCQETNRAGKYSTSEVPCFSLWLQSVKFLLLLPFPKHGTVTIFHNLPSSTALPLLIVSPMPFSFLLSSSFPFLISCAAHLPYVPPVLSHLLSCRRSATVTGENLSYRTSGCPTEGSALT